MAYGIQLDAHPSDAVAATHCDQLFRWGQVGTCLKTTMYEGSMYDGRRSAKPLRIADGDGLSAATTYPTNNGC